MLDSSGVRAQSLTVFTNTCGFCSAVDWSRDEEGRACVEGTLETAASALSDAGPNQTCVYTESKNHHELYGESIVVHFGGDAKSMHWDTPSNQETLTLARLETVPLYMPIARGGSGGSSEPPFQQSLYTMNLYGTLCRPHLLNCIKNSLEPPLTRGWLRA